MLISLVLLIMFYLSALVLPVSLGISLQTNFIKKILFLLIPVIFQLLFFWLGFLLGSQFLFLMEDFKNITIFIGFFLIGIRFVTDAFVIRKGKRTFQTAQLLHVSLASVAQSVNAFLIGMIFYFFAFDKIQTSVFLALFTLIFAFSGMLLTPTKKNLSFASLLILSGGIFLVGVAFYLGFFI